MVPAPSRLSAALAPSVLLPAGAPIWAADGVAYRAARASLEALRRAALKVVSEAGRYGVRDGLGFAVVVGRFAANEIVGAEIELIAVPFGGPIRARPVAEAVGYERQRAVDFCSDVSVTQVTAGDGHRDMGLQHRFR
jgi:hypothetical protein